MTRPTIEQVYIIFKTHLDVGFTDFAENVVQDYFVHHLPKAMALSARLRSLGRPERFVWTTGSWLIYHYLEQASPEERTRMEQAILAGDIAWHALPFTTHSELLDPALFRAGLRFSQVLDRRFGKTTRAGILTDVPGHTRAIVPLLAEAGITFLHVGVNDACAQPIVPPLFRWQDPTGAEITVIYHPAYGGTMRTPDAKAAVAFEFTLDNMGPPALQALIPVFARLRQQFPGATVQAVSPDALAELLAPSRELLPVVTQEIGDTWIHGVGTDPRKIQRYRELSRLHARWLAEQRFQEDDPTCLAFTQQLLLVAEHTWGMDTIMHLADTHSYALADFQAARAEGAFLPFERSWQEQRTYLDNGLAALAPVGLREMAEERLQAIAPVQEVTALPWQSSPPAPIETEHFSVRIDPVTGCLQYVIQRATGRTWATAEGPLAVLRYDSYGAEDYTPYLTQYVAPQFQSEWWPPYAFGKPGLEREAQTFQTWMPQVSEWAIEHNTDGVRLLVNLHFPASCASSYGPPPEVVLTYDFPHAEPAIHVDLTWRKKPACRMTEALWLSFQPPVASDGSWWLDKLGQWISTVDVVAQGNRQLHAVNTGFQYRDTTGVLTIETLDAPLVAPGRPRLLQFDGQQPAPQQGMHVNLYNNVWPTNFPQWSEGDARFRFVLRWSAAKTAGVK